MRSVSKTENQGSNPCSPVMNTYDIEIWRTKYTKDAFVDESGVNRWAYIVHEQKLVKQIGTEEWIEPYSKKTVQNGHKILMDEEGNTYKTIPSTDYYGTTTIICLNTNEHWEYARINPIGCIYPDGTGPVKNILERNNE